MERSLCVAWTICVISAFVWDSHMVQGAELRVRRNDKVIKVTSIKEPPYLMVKTSGKGNGRYEGYIPELMEKIASKAGLKFELTLVKDGLYGTKQSSGSWNGMIGELVSKQADLAAAPITISDERKKVVTFTEPIMTFTTTVLIKTPAEGSTQPVTSVKDLSDQTDVKYGIIKDGMTQNFFKNSDNPVYKKMWQYMESHPNNLHTNMSSGIKQVRESNGKYAFIIETPTAEYWMNKYPCELKKLGDLHNQYSYGLATAKSSNNPGLHQKVNSAIEELKESGELKELKEKWWKSAKACSNGAGSSSFSSYSASTYFTIAFILTTHFVRVRFA